MLIVSASSKELFEGDIKYNPDEKLHSADGVNGAAVKCPTHRIRCNRLWDAGVIPYKLSRLLRKFSFHAYLVSKFPKVYSSLKDNSGICLINT